MATTLAKQLVLDALNMALRGAATPGVIHHSDQGSQADSSDRRNTIFRRVSPEARHSAAQFSTVLVAHPGQA